MERAKVKVIEVIKAEGQDPETRKIAMNALGRTLEAKCCYLKAKCCSGDDNPLSMVFQLIEITLNIKLNEQQVEKIESFIEYLIQFKKVAFQFIMGAGKTSVFQPVAAYVIAFLLIELLGNQSDLSIVSTIIVPETLYEPVVESLVKTRGTALRQRVFSLLFNRNLAKNPSFLKVFQQGLEEIASRKGCLLLVPKQKHSIHTSLY